MTRPELRALNITLTALVLLGSAGFFLGLANPLAQFPPLALLFPATLILLSRLAQNGKTAFRVGWAEGTLACSAVLYWVTVPLHDFGGLPWLLTLPCLVALGAYVGLYPALFVLLLRLYRSHLPPLLVCLMAGMTWGGLEILRGWLFTGFPWPSLSTAFVTWPVWAQGASLFGATGLSAIYVCITALLVEAAPLRYTGRFSPPVPRRPRLVSLWLAVAVLAGLYGYGVHQLSSPYPSAQKLRVGLVQGNINQFQKWEPRYQENTLNRYLTLSERAVNPALGGVAAKVDLLVWPETAMPFYLEENPAYAERLTAFASRWKVDLAFGAPGKLYDAKAGETWHNRLWLYAHEPFSLQYYDKVHLVPFGEYVPLGLQIPFIEYLMQGMDFTPGKAGLLNRDGLALGPLICYEAIFPGLARERVALGANIFVNISNDAWFGRTAAPEQHVQLTAMRSVEQGRFTVRATNTGISAVIDSQGRILARGGLFRAEVITGEALLLNGKTWYFYWAPYLDWLLQLLPITVALVCLVRGRKIPC